MILIQASQVAQVIEDALKNGKKNLLFVNKYLDTDPFLEWFDNQTGHKRISCKPNYLSGTDRRGIVQKVNPPIAVITDHDLEMMNDDRAILFLYPFGERCIYGFDRFLDIIKNRTYTNVFPNGTRTEHSVKKMKLFVGYATPSGSDGFSLNEQYYNLFDEVYMIQTLKEKLDGIDDPKLASTIGLLPTGNDITIADFFDSFIKPRLPKKDVIKKWHRVLMDYVSSLDYLSCAVRYGNDGSKAPSSSGETGYQKLRRGWLTQNRRDGFEYFFADNYMSSFIYKMAIDGFVPALSELERCFSKQEFPYGFGFHIDRTYEAECCVVPVAKEPGFLGNYKISHIFNSGKFFDVNGVKYKEMKALSEAFFDIGARGEWLKEPDHIRKADISQQSKEVIRACFLRFVHPFNYFLTPSKKHHQCTGPAASIKDIGEYPPLVEYVRQYIQREYPNEYQEFLKYIMWDNSSAAAGVTGKEIINISYGPSVHPTSSGGKTKSSKKASTRKKTTSNPLPKIYYSINSKEVEKDRFIDDLLQKKAATFELVYSSGEKKTVPWNAAHFKRESNLLANIQSKPFWRSKDKDGLIRVNVLIN